MITKERLEALIKQGATVYCFRFDEVLEEKLGPNHFVDWELDNMFLSKWDEDTHKPICDIYYIFKHKEEAEHFQWSLEFECIERTERLELPTWEEFRVIGGFAFYDYKHNPISVNICLDPVNVAPCNDCIYIADSKNEYFCKPKTKENYTLACRKCKELFLGE